MTPEERITEARRAKVDKLVAFFVEKGFSSEVAAAVSPELWDKITDVVGVSKLRREDDTTRLMVLGELKLRECAGKVFGCRVSKVSVIR